MAKRESRKTAGKGGKSAVPEKKESGELGPVGVERGQEVTSLQLQEAKPALAPARTLTHDQIAGRAKKLWQQHGCPQGKDDYIWHEAERQLKRELGME
ncbi:MAG TPA: DUF2934 domain-containing protein [Sedimentisphaerales bacterium]|jgi:hypothetical protein|nr:DUF2934 domain-containing protein [Sedimentisphaerales bacterium]HNU29501.1 DUF2934 domain-containing protein [Sedimentisphaerales bacterium]